MTARLCAIVALLALAGCGRGTPPPAPAPKTDDTEAASAAAASVTLSAEDAARLGLTVRPATGAHGRKPVRGDYLVVSHEATAALAAELAAAEAAVAQSSAALGRLKGLAGGTGAYSDDALDAAARQAAVDSAARDGVEHRLTALLGQTPDARRSLSDWASGRLKLVRLTFAYGSVVRHAPNRVIFAPDGASDLPTHNRVQAVWLAPADPAIPGNSYWASVAEPDLAEGSRGSVWADAGADTAGVRVPASAVVVYDSASWCYVEQPTGTFRRVRVPTDHRLDDGFLVHDGVRVGDGLVVHGAALLLARETGAPADDAP